MIARKKCFNHLAALMISTLMPWCSSRTPCHCAIIYRKCQFL